MLLLQRSLPSFFPSGQLRSALLHCVRQQHCACCRADPLPLLLPCCRTDSHVSVFSCCPAGSLISVVSRCRAGPRFVIPSFLSRSSRFVVLLLPKRFRRSGVLLLPSRLTPFNIFPSRAGPPALSFSCCCAGFLVSLFSCGRAIP